MQLINDAYRAVNRFERWQKKMACQQPHLYGPGSHQYFLDTVASEQMDREKIAALNKIYQHEPEVVSTLWSDRYPEFAQEAREEMKNAKPGKETVNKQ